MVSEQIRSNHKKMVDSSMMRSFPVVILQPISEKLCKNNHATWCNQVLIVLCGALHAGYVTDKKKAHADEIEDKVDDQKIMVPNSEYKD
jgi:hypothetical protein